jgi:acyl-CoA dehydrogenase
VIEAGARRLALTLGRALELALVTGHAAWCLETRSAGAARAVAAARRLCRNGVDLLTGGMSSGLSDAVLVSLGDLPPTLTESRTLALAEAVPQS